MMFRTLKLNFVILFILIVTGCSDKTFFAENGELAFPEDIRINQIQVLGTHNSYSLPADQRGLEYLEPVYEQMSSGYFENLSEDEKKKYLEFHPNEVTLTESLSYHHPDFIEQLNEGIRSFEIDVYYDPTGDRFTHPASYQLLKQKGEDDFLPYDIEALKEPGFKVMHIPDIDFRTHYATLEQALTVLNNWSEKNPSHVPIFIMIEAKDKGIPLFPNSADVLPFDKNAFEQLDEAIVSVLGKEKIITPDMVQDNYPTLKEAILANNWPKLSESLGKFVFMLLPSTAGMSDDNVYVENNQLKGKMMFVQSNPDDEFGAFLLLDNAIQRKAQIEESVKKGYLIRTRADIDTYEAKVNDKTRAAVAFKSGAQVVSTDYFKPGNAYGTEYFVELPSNKPVRINPLFSIGYNK